MKELEISVQTVVQKLNKGEDMLLLDIRPLEQRKVSSIPGSIHREVYTQLVEGDDTIFDEEVWDKTIPIITFCGGGKTSLLAAALLQKKGYLAWSLQGGLQAWNQVQSQSK